MSSENDSRDDSKNKSKDISGRQLNEYFKYYYPHRVQLDQKIGFLSGGLKTIVYPIIEKSKDKGGSDKIHLISFNSENTLMGGAYFWEHDGFIKIDESKKRAELPEIIPANNFNKIFQNKHKDDGVYIPLYKEGRYINDLKKLYPFNGNDSLAICMDASFFSIYRRTGIYNFEIDEELSEKFGIGLLDAGLNTISISKLLIMDFTKNGLPDVIIGENDWSEYFPRYNGRVTRWSDKNYISFNEDGKWRGGRLHGRVYLMINEGLDPDEESYIFSKPIALKPIDQYGYSSPVVFDFNGNGLEDIITGSFIRDITFYKRIKESGDIENGETLFDKGQKILEMPGVINYLINIDFNQNGKMDLLVGSENGHIYFVENTGELDENGAPIFKKPVELYQRNPPLKADILAVPAVSDLTTKTAMDKNNRKDLICGTGAGYFEYFSDIFNPKYLGSINSIPRILPPLEAGSIQGPSEIGWGYTAPTLFDWNDNGRVDLIFGDINGNISISFNLKNTSDNWEIPNFSPPYKFKVLDNLEKLRDQNKSDKNDKNYKNGIIQYKIRDLISAWRVKPALCRIGDELYLFTLGTLDEFNGNLTIYKRVKAGVFHNDKDNNKDKDKNKENIYLEYHDFAYLHGTKRIPIKFTNRFGGSIGRAKLFLFDWTQNGAPDLIVGLPKNHHIQRIKTDTEVEYVTLSHSAPVVILENKSSPEELKKGIFQFSEPKYLKLKESGDYLKFGHHSCAPHVFRNSNEVYLVVGAEDGHCYLYNKKELFF